MVGRSTPPKSGKFIRANSVTGSITETRDPWDAMHFKTKKKCENWCEDNPDPQCIAIQRGFAEKE